MMTVVIWPEALTTRVVTMALTTVRTELERPLQSSQLIQPSLEKRNYTAVCVCGSYRGCGIKLRHFHNKLKVPFCGLIGSSIAGIPITITKKINYGR